MKISTGYKKVRATELLTTRGVKAALLILRRWYKKNRASPPIGKTGVSITIDRSANRENEINEVRAFTEEGEKRKRTILALDEDELRNIVNENTVNELRELMSAIGMTDTDQPSLKATTLVVDWAVSTSSTWNIERSYQTTWASLEIQCSTT